MSKNGIVVIVPSLKDTESNNIYEKSILKEYKDYKHVIVIRDNMINKDNLTLKTRGIIIDKVEFRTLVSTFKYSIIAEHCYPSLASKVSNDIQRVIGASHAISYKT